MTVREGVALIAEERGTRPSASSSACSATAAARLRTSPTSTSARKRAAEASAARCSRSSSTPARDAGLAHVSLEVLVSQRRRAAGSTSGSASLRSTIFMVAPLDAFAERIGSDERPQSFGSLHVQTDDRAGVERAVAQFLPRVGRSEWTEVAASANGWVAVVDELCDRDRSAQRRLGAELSERMGVPRRSRSPSRKRGRPLPALRPRAHGRRVPLGADVLRRPEQGRRARPSRRMRRSSRASPVPIRRACARSRARASSPSELPPARELIEQIAAVMNSRLGSIDDHALRRRPLPLLRACTDRARREGHRVRDGRDRPRRPPRLDLREEPARPRARARGGRPSCCRSRQ